MLYIFGGDNTQKKLENYEKFMDSLDEETQIFSITKNEFDPALIESFYSGTTLFSSVSVVVFQNILAEEDLREFFMEKLDVLSKSTNKFVFWEGKLGKPVVDAFKKVRAEVSISEQQKESIKKFDNFLIANAFGSKDKLHTWMYFRQAIVRGVSLEEIVGILFWKTKDMILRRNFGKFSPDELKGISSRISCLLPSARKRGPEAESALEQFLLEAF